MGLQFSQATAVYRGKDQQEIHLEITDTAGARALLGLSGEASGNMQGANDNGFDKLQHAGDRILHSTWNDKLRRGGYVVLLGHRFSVRASGHVKAFTELERAANAVDLDALDKLGGTRGPH